jgi:predicted MFS family arabinose efflux permease
MSPNLLKVMCRSFLFGLAAVSVLALLPLVTRDLVAGGAFSYGLILGFFGMGALGGALVNDRIRARWSNETIVRASFLIFALSTVALALSRQMWLSCLAVLPAGACWVVALSLFNVTVQLSTPRWVVGRALALYQTATFGGMAAGSWLWGGGRRVLWYRQVVAGRGCCPGTGRSRWLVLRFARIQQTQPRPGRPVQRTLA